MSMPASYSLVILIGYLLGSLNLALLLAKLKGVDIRAGGSGNPGASNAVTLMGWKAGVLVALHDIGKGILAVWLCGRLFPALPYCGAVAGAYYGVPEEIRTKAETFLDEPLLDALHGFESRFAETKD